MLGSRMFGRTKTLLGRTWHMVPTCGYERQAPEGQLGARKVNGREGGHHGLA